jgi:hypothetical protein
VDGQFAGDFYQPRIGGPFRDGHAQERYARAGDALPVGIPATDHGVEKQQPDEVAVATRYLAKVDEQRGREGVPGEHVEAAAEHDRWGVDQAVEQQLCLGPDVLSPGGARRDLPIRERVQIPSLVITETQRVGDGVQHAGGRTGQPPLLQPRVVGGADHGELGDLFAPQARHPA